MSQLDDAFSVLHAEAQAFTQSVRQAHLLAKSNQDYDVKRLAAQARRLQDHLDTLKGLTQR